MSSATKALALLSYFSTARPEIGLSQMCRIAGRDKATTFRHLQALESAGLIEQNPTTKHYRLGPAVMRLAHLREVTLPRQDGAKPAIQALSEATGETAHVTVLSGQTLYGLCENESPQHSTRAVIDLNTFPLHATASGLCALAFGPAELLGKAARNMDRFTDQTATTPEQLHELANRIRATGFAHAEQSYEAEIQGLAVPLFDHTEQLAGAVAVACVASRFTPELAYTIKSELVIAARDITHNWGGAIPEAVETAWAHSLKTTNTLESTS